MSLPDQILAVSPGTAERLRSYLGDSIPIRVIPKAVDLELIRNLEPAAPRIPPISSTSGACSGTRESIC